ncbi:MAG: hypothetical protein ABIU54_13830 [Candidatus Eisenbacteria bacterium]
MRILQIAVLLWALDLTGSVVPAAAQEHASGPPARRLRLFLDCSDDVCDFDYLKREMAWVDWVRDRADADVNVLVTTRDTGADGTEATFFVMRPRGGGPSADTLVVFSPSTASEDDERKLIHRTLAALIARDAITRPGAEGLNVSFVNPDESSDTHGVAVKDPWNHWVYKLSTNGYLNGEKSYRSISLYSALSGTRVTEANKVGASVSQNYSQNEYEFDNGSRFTSVTRSWSARGQWVRSFSPKWSAGFSTGAYSSSFSNTDRSIRIGPALEYDFFPYSESSRRSLTLGYQINLSQVHYEMETLYGKLSEELVAQELDMSMALRHPWGTVDVRASLNQYLHDPSKYRVTTSGSFDLKLWKGFSLGGYGFVARIRDQLSLPRGDATNTEVLARRRQLATAFQYSTSFGISYSFGSIFDSVVNQRLQNTFGGI